ncbi:MAG TPA: hypothetical protein VNQ48_09100 [Microbacteriaceae bacterium]|nr:hypothetical protein [Microbacteriaceae bacterium]
MQLGTRWDVGDEPPGTLAEAMRHGIQRVEAELIADRIDTTGWRWTLTWLERRPIAELDDGTRVAQHADGTVSILPLADDEA